jgi:hypothetical protein
MKGEGKLKKRIAAGSRSYGLFKNWIPEKCIRE